MVDIGGGNGQFLAELLAKHPQLRGVLVDQQGQVERGQKVNEPAAGYTQSLCLRYTLNWHNVAVVSRTVFSYQCMSAVVVPGGCITAPGARLEFVVGDI